MARILINLHNNKLAGIVDCLNEKENCEVAEWIGKHKNSTINLRRDMSLGFLKHDKCINFEQKVYEKVYEGFLTYYIFQNRIKHTYLKGYKFYDYLDFFNIYFQKFYDTLTSKKIDLVILMSMPHTGFDYILYLTAKALNIEVLMFSQSLFPNRFFYFSDIEDYGTFSYMMRTISDEKISIPKQFKKELFYMEKNFALKQIKFINPKIFFRTLWSYIRTLPRLPYDLRYFRNLKNSISNNFDIESNFVYFPLHLQPEMTTSTLGGIYKDQALALERLSALLPDDWNIYVKENPIQESEYQRGKGFFERLKAIKNLKILPRETDTYMLLEKCKFVATITGTAGWESVTGGKPSLIFGNAWYKNLPGVFTYSPELDINDLLNYKIDHTELENAVNELLSKMPYGVTETVYSEMLENFDYDENNRLIAEFISNFVEEQQI